MFGCIFILLQCKRQYKDHAQFFRLVKKKMKLSKDYYEKYKKSLSRLSNLFRYSLQTRDSDSIMVEYTKLWDIIYDFFTSNEYLNTYNPVFAANFEDAEKDEILSKVFEIRPIDINMHFYNILIHLIQEQIMQEKYCHLSVLQKIIKIQRRFYQYRKNKDSFSINLDNTENK